MEKVNTESGIAVALVLLILALVTLVGAGLMAQSRMDSKYNAALRTYDKMFNLADGGAARSYGQIQVTETVGFTGESVYADIENATVLTVGKWEARVAIKGYSTDPQDSPGWELGTGSGFHIQFWIGEGDGSRAVAGTLPEATINVAAIKMAKN